MSRSQLYLYLQSHNFKCNRCQNTRRISSEAILNTPSTKRTRLKECECKTSPSSLNIYKKACTHILKCSYTTLILIVLVPFQHLLFYHIY
jgi:hypothetical protein